MQAWDNKKQVSIDRETKFDLGNFQRSGKVSWSKITLEIGILSARINCYENGRGAGEKISFWILNSRKRNFVLLRDSFTI